MSNSKNKMTPEGLAQMKEEIKKIARDLSPEFQFFIRDCWGR